MIQCQKEWKRTLPSNEVEYEYLPFRLLHERECLVEPVRPSGFSPGGLYILSEESDYALKTSMLAQVTALGPGCVAAELGEVYICPVYCWDDFDHDGRTYHITHELNLKAKWKNYYADHPDDEQPMDSGMCPPALD